MKHLIALITLFSGTLWAQSSPSSGIPSSSSPANGPSYSQMYCSGFITRDAIPRTNFVLGSKESPHEDRIQSHSIMFLGGPGLVEGERYSLLRQVDDPNHEDSSPEQRKKLSKLGALYAEVGWITVHSVQPGVSIASFDFACDVATRGDIVVPYKERSSVFFRTTDGPIGSFRPAADAVHGHILGSKDFVGLLGTGLIVYTDFGSAKGARPGDYLLVTRGYAPDDLNKIDRASEQLPKGAEDTAVNPARIKANSDVRIPQHVLGEALVLNVSPDSSTAILTRSFAEMELGDVVQSEEPHLATAEPAATENSCHPASRLHRLVHLQLHPCKADAN
jgi:hypothetical protein